MHKKSTIELLPSDLSARLPASETDQSFRRIVELLPQPAALWCDGRIIYNNKSDDVLWQSVEPTWLDVLAERAQDTGAQALWFCQANQRVYSVVSTRLEGLCLISFFPTNVGLDSVVSEVEPSLESLASSALCTWDDSGICLRSVQSGFERLMESFVVHSMLSVEMQVADFLGCDVDHDLRNRAAQWCQTHGAISFLCASPNTGTVRHVVYVAMVVELSADPALSVVHLYCHNVSDRITIESGTPTRADQVLSASQNARRIAKLIEAESEMSAIVDTVAHDLKNPITNILLNLDMMREFGSAGLDQETLSYIDNAVNATVRMSSITSSLLQSQKLESGKYKIEIDVFDVAWLVNECIAPYYEAAKKKSIRVLVENTQSQRVWSDMHAVQQILDNLISNALKYTRIGGTVRITTYPHGGRVLVSVHDEGPGIRSEDMSKLFTKFSKLKSKPTGGEEATGLGLWIVKRFADVIEASVSVESHAGQGATFTLAIPIGTAPEIPDE